MTDAISCRLETMLELALRDGGATDLRVVIDYGFRPGTLPSGLSGPPENYDPGAGAECGVVAFWLFRDGVAIDVPAWLRAWVLDDQDILTAMIAEGYATVDRARDIAAERRLDQARDDAIHHCTV